MADTAANSFPYDGGDLHVTKEMQKCFDDDGYFVVKSLLTSEELKKVTNTLEGENEILKHSYVLSDGHGRNSRLIIWSHPGNDITGMVGRCQKVAGVTEKILGGEVYHYHTKLIMKEAHTGGSFVWHQDYGYWYQNGCLVPDMATVFIAIDKCDKENGCLKILSGSHKAGRIDHVRVGGQNGADLERVQHLQKMFPLLHVELEAGDALFFHCNVLHRSEQNQSDRRRWAFLCSYNRASNNPVIPHHHPMYTPLHMVPNSAILECNTTDVSGKDFMDPDTDRTTIGKKDT